MRADRAAGFLLAVFLGSSCGVPDRVAVPGAPGRFKTAAPGRAERRAFDGAPPVIPHPNFGAACVACHTTGGVEVPGVGFAPPSPHADTPGLSAISRCRQCHVFRATGEVMTASTFEGLKQDLRAGRRLYDGAPPVIPHAVWMRENCRACHTGPAAREEIRTSHPERTRCRQCHLEAVTGETFARP